MEIICDLYKAEVLCLKLGKAKPRCALHFTHEGLFEAPINSWHVENMNIHLQVDEWLFIKVNEEDCFDEDDDEYGFDYEKTN